MNNIILAPIDFSEHSLQASMLALNVASRLDKSVVFLHVADNPKVRIGDQIDQFQAQLLTWFGQGKAARVPYSLEIRHGVAEDEIKQYVSDATPYLVVMATRGKAEKQKDLIGSVTAEVLDVVEVPVLAVPEQFAWQNMKGIDSLSFATSMQTNEQESLSLLKDILPANILSKITFIHFYKQGDALNTANQKAIETTMQGLMPQVTIDFQYLPYQGRSLEKDFVQFLASDDSDLMVVKNSHRNLLRRSLKRSLAKQLAWNADKPILVL